MDALRHGGHFEASPKTTEWICTNPGCRDNRGNTTSSIGLIKRHLRKDKTLPKARQTLEEDTFVRQRRQNRHRFVASSISDPPELRTIMELIVSELSTGSGRENLPCNEIRLLQKEVMGPIWNNLNTGVWNRGSQLVGTQDPFDLCDPCGAILQ